MANKRINHLIWGGGGVDISKYPSFQNSLTLRCETIVLPLYTVSQMEEIIKLRNKQNMVNSDNNGFRGKNASGD